MRDLDSFTLALLLIWVAIYALQYLLGFSTRRALLPTAYMRHRLHTLRAGTLSPSKFVLKHLHLRIESLSWNASHDALSAALAQRRNPWSKRLKFLYNVGSVLCILSMLGSLAVLSSVLWQLVSVLWRVYDPLSKTPSEGFVRRSLDITHGPPKPQALSPVLKPIIPGLTVPLSHLPLTLTAVFIAQFIHEMGHAVSAALESVPMISVGASLFVFLPTTFVRLSSTAIDSLQPAGRLRVITAGSFHNLLFWCLLAVLCNSGIGMAVWSLPYSNISSIGRVVTSVEPHSSLYGHLPAGSLITALSDVGLNITKGAMDASMAFNASAVNESMIQKGWCIDKTQFSDMPESCCAQGQTTAGSSLLSCFRTFEPHSVGGCLNLVQVLGTSSRCSHAGECLHEHTCVRLSDSQQLLRIVFRLPQWSRSTSHADDEVIIWKGLQSEFAEEVQMGVLLPRFSFLPVWLPSAVQLLIEYLQLASASLYLFNLLPLQYLDGGKLLKVLLAVSFHPRVMEEADLEAGGRPVMERWKRTSRLIHIITVTLMGTTLFLACVHVLAA